MNHGVAASQQNMSVTLVTPWCWLWHAAESNSQLHSCSIRALPGCRAQGMNLALPVGILHLAAFTMGYWLCKGLKFNEKTARTVSIETGRLTLVSRLTPVWLL